MLYFTSPWQFCNCRFVILNPLFFLIVPLNLNTLLSLKTVPLETAAQLCSNSPHLSLGRLSVPLFWSWHQGSGPLLSEWQSHSMAGHWGCVVVSSVLSLPLPLWNVPLTKERRWGWSGPSILDLPSLRQSHCQTSEGWWREEASDLSSTLAWSKVSKIQIGEHKDGHDKHRQVSSF